MNSNRRNRKDKKEQPREISRPIILKKEEKDPKKQQEVRVLSQQPKILTKPKETKPENATSQAQGISSQTQNVASTSTASAPQLPQKTEDVPTSVVIKTPVQPEVPRMDVPIKLVNSSYASNTNIRNYLHDDNGDFLVVGCIGTKSVGKSTILNILARHNYLKKGTDNTYRFDEANALFAINNQEPVEGIDAFITKERLFLLESTPLLNNQFKRFNIASELDDLKTLLILMATCHVLIVVQDDYTNINFLRLILCAENMKISINKSSNYSSNIIFVHNKISKIEESWRTQRIKLYQKIFVNSKLNIYEEQLYPSFQEEEDPEVRLRKQQKVNYFNFLDISVKQNNRLSVHDISQQADALKRMIRMINRSSMWIDFEQVTEKKWWQILNIIVDAVKTDYFLRQYETFREKFCQNHQHTLMIVNEKENYYDY